MDFTRFLDEVNLRIVLAEKNKIKPEFLRF